MKGIWIRSAWATLAALFLLGLAGCPRQTRHTLVPEIPHNGDSRARSRFEEARAKFLRDGGGGAELARIAAEFPDDPIAPWAHLYAGIAALRARSFTQAQQELTAAVAADVDSGLTARAELFLGIAKNYLGDAAAALPLLRRSSKLVETEDERTEYLAALAFATAAAGEQPLAALPLFDQLYSRVTPTERAVIVQRAQEVAARAPADALRRTFDELAERRGPGLAAVATRLALLADAAGRPDEAKQMRDAAAPARVAVGLPITVSAATAPAGQSGGGGGGEAGLVGAVMPLGGKQNRVAEAAVAGLSTAAGVGDAKGAVAVEVRTANDANAAAQAVADLAAANVVAIVGPIEGDAVDAASERAEGLEVPILSLATRPESRTTGRFVFHIVHSAESRARSLAAAALAKGVKTFAVLAPQNGYGKAVAAAFVDAVKAGGGTIVKHETYAATTKSFGPAVGTLSGKWDAVFIPDQADQLELIVPALAASGLVPMPPGTKKVQGGRPVLLLSTAEGLSGSYLANAGRHSEGALLAPGYYPDDQAPAQKEFLNRFIAAFGRAPGALEAYAYDAAQLVAAAGASGRVGLANALVRGELAGVTGTLRFSSDKHLRSDGGVLYTVVSDQGAYAIRVAK